MRPVDAVRLAYGAALLLAPQQAARLLSGRRLDGRAELTARVLGLRHLAQAVVLACDDRAEVRRLGATVDRVHAGSMLVLAAWVPGRERVALTDAVVEVLLGAASTERTRGRRGGGGPPVATTDELDLPAPPHPFGVSVPADDALGGDPVARRRRNARLQRAVHEAYLTARGGEVTHVRRVLEDAVRDAGLAPPTATWLDAAAAEVASGHIYVVSGPAMQDAGIELPPHRPV
jgi:hypothetical protein